MTSEDADDFGATIIALRPAPIPREADDISDAVFRASLASVLTTDECSRQELLEAVADRVRRGAELRHDLEVVAEMLHAGDVDGAERHLAEVLTSGEVSHVR